MEYIRPKVIVSLVYENRLLFIDVEEPLTEIPRYIPVGGGLEFGETLLEGAKREVLEEAQVVIEDLTFLSFHECIFNWGNSRLHHLIYHYYSELDEATYSKIPAESLEANGMPLIFEWVAITELEKVKERLLPSGIYEDYKNLFFEKK